MFIETVENIFDLFPDLIVHPVSCTGVARDIHSRRIKHVFPDYFREYTRLSIRKNLKTGQIICTELDALFGTRFMVTLPIKDTWQEKLNPETVKNALNSLQEMCSKTQPSSIAFPIFKGPPEGWLEKELTARFGEEKWPHLEKIFITRVDD